MHERKQYCTFHVAEHMYGVDVLKVQEVLQSVEVTEVPLAPAMVRGLMNLRGSIVTSIDLRTRFQLEPREATEETAHVVMQTDTGLISFTVDRIGDVMDVDAKQHEPPPSTLRGESQLMIEAVYKLDNGLMLALNINRLMGGKG